MLTKKIGILYLYYGSWPWFFDLFLKSCSFNLNVTFIFITDIEFPKKYSKNVKFIRKPLGEVAERASEKLGFNVNLNNPYKLCDFKPLYGYLFDDVLSSFDFWGHGDIDLVIGQIDSFIDDDVLNNNEVVSVRHEYPTGFFMLYKNVPKINTLFKLSKDYKAVFSSNEHFCFDECNFQHLPLMEGVDIFNTESKIESMMHVIKKAERDKRITAYFDFHVLEGIPRGTVCWKNGTLSYIRNKKEYEILLFHFIQLKANRYFVIPKWKDIPNTFYMDHLGFFKHPETSVMGFLNRLINVLKFEGRKRSVQAILSLNKILLLLIPKRKNVNSMYQGNYECGHVLVSLKNENNQNVLQRLFPSPDKTKAKIESVFFRDDLYVDYHSYTLYKLKNDKMVLRTKYGQEIVYNRVKAKQN